MKLSMWMIANQLIELEPTLQIKENSPVNLNSAHLAYATNCVHLRQKGCDVVLSANGDRIILHDMSVYRAFELVQAIFDAHEDWISQVIEAVDQRDYQKAVDEGVKMLKNPLVLFDVNNKVLGISSAYGPDALDEEWHYLHTYGYSSINAFTFLRSHIDSHSLLNPGLHPYALPGNQRIGHKGFTTPLYFNGNHCGVMTLIAKERGLNPGDGQLLMAFAGVLTPMLGALSLQEGGENHGSIFSSIMQGASYSKDELALQLTYRGWRPNDTFCVTVMEVANPTGNEAFLKTDANTLMRTVHQQIKDVTVISAPPYVTILSNRPLYSDQSVVRLLYHIVSSNPVRIAFSLPAEGITNIRMLYNQCLFALKQKPSGKDDLRLIHFEEFAIQYIMSSTDPPEEKLLACMPAVRKLWQKKQLGDEMFHTLHCYLNSERSISQTATALFLHRNTAVYRIKKIQDYLHCDLDDPKVRDYCLLSVLMLEAYDKR